MLKLIIEIVIGIIWAAAGAYMAKNNKNRKSGKNSKSSKSATSDKNNENVQAYILNDDEKDNNNKLKNERNSSMKIDLNFAKFTNTAKKWRWIPAIVLLIVVLAIAAIFGLANFITDCMWYSQRICAFIVNISCFLYYYAHSYGSNSF